MDYNDGQLGHTYVHAQSITSVDANNAYTPCLKKRGV